MQARLAENLLSGMTLVESPSPDASRCGSIGRCKGEDLTIVKFRINLG